MSAGIELHFDEAQYWVWSQHLDWGYYSKGPLLAWLIRLSTEWFGQGEWQVRLFGWLMHGLFLATLFGFSQQVWRNRVAGWWALLIGATTPMYFSLSLVMTTDNPLLLFWSLGLWAVYRAMILDHPRSWYLAGIAIGVGALAKLSILLLPAFTGLLVLLCPHLRPHLTSRQPWLGMLLMLLCMSPMLLWNINHDWVLFRHELNHIRRDALSWVRPLEFLVGQILALSPLVVIVTVAVLRRVPGHTGERFLWLFGLTGLAFFSYKSYGSSVLLNWPAPVYVAFIVLLSGYIPHLGTVQRKLFYGGIGISIVMLTVALNVREITGDMTRDPLIKLRYWRASIEQVAGKAGQVQFLLTDTYPLASELAFYWPKRLPVYLTGNPARRFNQFDLWPGIEREVGHGGLFVSTSPEVPEQLATAFRHCRPLDPVVVLAADGNRVRTLYSQMCDGYIPIDWPKPQRY